MYYQSTHRISQFNQRLRAGVLLFLTLCLLISCPLKRELRATFAQPNPPVNQAAPSHYPKEVVSNFSSTDFESICTKVVHSILDEVDPASFFQKYNFENPAVSFAIALAGFYLLLLASRSTSILHYTFPSDILAAKVPLFLRNRQLVI
jgi:hypothetical protein